MQQCRLTRRLHPHEHLSGGDPWPGIHFLPRQAGGRTGQPLSGGPEEEAVVRRGASLLPIVALVVTFAGTSPDRSHRGKEIPIPTAVSHPYGIASGPDGNLWFTE